MTLLIQMSVWNNTDTVVKLFGCLKCFILHDVANFAKLFCVLIYVLCKKYTNIKSLKFLVCMNYYFYHRDILPDKTSLHNLVISTKLYLRIKFYKSSSFNFSYISVIKFCFRY